jgi:hypothetical protein
MKPFDYSDNGMHLLVWLEFSNETVEAFVIVLGIQARIMGPLIKGYALC